MAKTSTVPGPQVRNRWFNTSSVGTKIFGASLTKQEFKDECDINHILARSPDGGRPWTNPPTLRYGDFADAPEFLAAQLLVKEAEDHFNSMPVSLRERFGHDPAQLLRFVHDPKNRAEAQRLGIFNPDPPPPPALEAEPAK
ncbi:MAG: internal scaffolding protein [Microvirus sp.]|nr:MAG: internal scaffolding protein [Microvirus sp.]